MTPLRQLIAPIVLALLTAGTLAGCSHSAPAGEAGRGGPAVARDAAQALARASSAHVVGYGNGGGHDLTWDLVRRGSDLSGTITVDDTPAELVERDGRIWFYANDEVWSDIGAGEDAAQELQYQWAELPAAFTESWLHLGLRQLVDVPTAATGVRKDVAVGNYQGRRTLVVQRTDGSRLWVADDGGPHYPLRIVTRGDADGTTTITDFGHGGSSPQPTNAVDLDQAGPWVPSGPEQGKTSAQLAAASVRALSRVKSGHYAGHDVESGVRTDLDVRLQGSAAAVTAMNRDGRISVVQVGGNSYVRGDAAGLRHQGFPAALADRLAGRWIEPPAGTGSSTGELTFAQLARGLRTGDLQTDMTFRRSGGKLVVVLTESGDDQLWVDGTGPRPYPIRVSGSGGLLRFDHLGRPMHIAPPAGALALGGSSSSA